MVAYHCLTSGSLNSFRESMKVMGNKYNETENKIIEVPVVTIDNFYNKEKTLIIHNYINEKGKMILNKEEASLLLLELYKFVNS